MLKFNSVQMKDGQDIQNVIKKITMNITLNLQSNSNQYKTEKTIFKFISTLASLNIIKSLSTKNQLSSELKQRRAVFKSDFDPEAYKKIVYPKLGITRHTSAAVIEKKQSAALQYAKILKQYDPSNSGELNDYFNYPELVYVIKKVFKQHVRGNGQIFYTGIAISVKKNHFFAKVSTGNICIFSERGNLIGNGASGLVYRIYEIATCQFLACKFANPKTLSGVDSICIEVANLKKMQRLMHSKNIQLEGIQEPIIADFYLPKKHLVGYLGPLYEIDLIDWIENPSQTPQIRIALCKSLMRIFMHMDKLGLWHGDIKPDNIMLKNNQPIVIDWAGFLLYEEAANQFITPIFSTPSYVNSIDFLTLKLLKTKKNPQFKSDFIKTAKSLELFSIAITLFMVLTSKGPFKAASAPDLDLIIPQTTFCLDTVALVDLKYSVEIINLMTIMLAHNPKDRYSIKEACAAWEKIEEK